MHNLIAELEAPERLHLSREMIGRIMSRPLGQTSPGYLVTRDDVLLVNVWNSTASQTIRVDLAKTLLSGEDLYETHLFNLNSNRTRNGLIITLDTCFVRGINVGQFSVTGRKGSCYAAILLLHAEGAVGPAPSLLASGYIDMAAGLGWPTAAITSSVDGNGLLRSITGTTPGAGAQISETVPTGARWRFRGLRASLTTSATVATRQVHFIVDDGANQIFDFPANGTQLASLTRNYDLSDVMSAPAATDSEIYASMSEELKLFQAWRVRTVVTNMQAGDQWTAPQYEVEEWIEV